MAAATSSHQAFLPASQGEQDQGGTTAANRPKVPWDLTKFQEVLSRSRLQCPQTSPAAVRQGQFQGYEWKGFFELRGSAMRLAMDTQTGERCELRPEGPEWNFSSTNNQPQVYQAHLRVQPQINHFTIMQIGQYQDLPGYTTGPVVMLGYRNDFRGIKDNLWMKVRADLLPNNAGYSFAYYDLGVLPTTEHFFELKVTVESSIVTVYINGREKATHDVSYLDALPETGWRTGPYVHGSSNKRQAIDFDCLYMGPAAQNPLVDEIISWPPTPSPTSSPTWTGYSHAPTQTPPQLEKLVLVNANNDKVVQDLTLTGVNHVYLADVPFFRVRAITASHTVESVVWYIDDENIDKENMKPFELLWNVRGNGVQWYNDGGTFEVSAVPFSEQQALGVRGEPVSATLVIRKGTSPYQTTSPPPTLAPTRTPTANTNPRPNNEPVLSHLSLIDCDTSQEVTSLSTSAVNDVDSDTLPRFSIEAMAGSEVSSVKFYLDGRRLRTENRAPFAIRGDRRNKYKPLRVAPGTYTITAVPYSRKRGRGDKGQPVTVQIRVSTPKNPTPSPPAPSPPTNTPPTDVSLNLSHFALINCDTSQAVTSLSTSTTNDVTLPRFSIEAIVAPGSSIRSVKFYIGSKRVRTESVKPYAVQGDKGGIYYPLELDPGTYTVTAIPYSKRGGKGIEGIPLTARIRV